MDQPLDGLLILTSPPQVEDLSTGVGRRVRDKPCADAAATSHTGWYCLRENVRQKKVSGFPTGCRVRSAWRRPAPPDDEMASHPSHPTPCRHKCTFFHSSVPGGCEKCYIHLWPVDVMRLGRARASPRAAIPLPISLCILCSFVYSCVFVCAGMPNPSPGGNTPRTISDHAPVSVTIHIGSWPLEGCRASLTDIKGREEAGPQRRCMRKHNWGHDFIVLKVQVSSKSEVGEAGKRD